MPSPSLSLTLFISALWRIRLPDRLVPAVASTTVLSTFIDMPPTLTLPGSCSSSCWWWRLRAERIADIHASASAGLFALSLYGSRPVLWLMFSMNVELPRVESTDSDPRADSLSTKPSVRSSSTLGDSPPPSVLPYVSFSSSRVNHRLSQPPSIPGRSFCSQPSIVERSCVGKDVGCLCRTSGSAARAPAPQRQLQLRSACFGLVRLGCWPCACRRWAGVARVQPATVSAPLRWRRWPLRRYGCAWCRHRAQQGKRLQRLSRRWGQRWVPKWI